jgi:aspartyl-tRNA(Asn)/glutamyl-tRNA(Gln) amidotransferase subunit B
MEYEAKRQRKAFGEWKKLAQETRGWVEEKGKTVAQRSKEYAHDYRYFPEPDLPPLSVSREWVEEIKARLPELPEDRRDRFMKEYGLPLYDADLLTSSRAMADYFEDICKANKAIPAKTISNWILGQASAIMNTNNIDIVAFREKVSPERFGRLVVLQSQAAATASTAKEVLVEMFKTGTDSDDIISERGLSQISDMGELEAAIVDVINSNAQAVSDYRSGKEEALKFLVGQVMRATKGRANPVLASELLQKKLGEG